MHKLKRLTHALAAAFALTAAHALPPTVNYDLPVSLDTGAGGAPLTTILEALAHTAGATLLMRDVPDVTVRYAIPNQRPVREVWSMLMDLHDLQYVMHDDKTIIVAPPDVLARFRPESRPPELVDAFYTPKENADTIAALITRRYEATTATFENRNTILVTATPDEQTRIQAFLDLIEQNLHTPTDHDDHAANATETATDQTATRPAETNEPTTLAFYELGKDAAGFLALLAQQHPTARAQPLEDGLIAIAATAEQHAEIAALQQQYRTALTATRGHPDDRDAAYVDYYDLREDAAGFLTLLSEQLPGLRARLVSDAGVIAITGTAKEHAQVIDHQYEYQRALRRAREGAPQDERAYALVNQDAEEAAEQLTASLGEDADKVTITANARTNTILVRGDAAAVAAAGRILTAIDQRVPQVMLTMRVTEITETEAERLGIDLTGSVGALAVNVLSSGLDLILNPLQSLSLDFTAALKALEEQNLARTVDEISVRVNHNQEATFNSGGQIQVALTDDQVTTLEFGTLLTVKPLISPDGTITLHVNSTISDFTGELDRLQGLRLTERDLQTVVTFHENDTIVLGGILRNSVNLTHTGTPILKDLPIIGGLFRHTEQGEERTDYVVIINAQLID